MGGDGGVIAAKREFMQSCGDVFGMKGGMAKTKLNRTETAELRVKVCAINNERLREPVAACQLGYLYNKDTLLSELLERNLNPAFSHIRGLKDIVECRLTPNPAFETEDRPRDGPEPSRFMCPITLQEMNGSHAFVVLFSTGWVMSEKAIKEVGIGGLQEEYGPFTEEDVVSLAPTDEEREVLKRELLVKREAIRAVKSAKKASKKCSQRDKCTTTTTATTTVPSSPTCGLSVASKSKATAEGAHDMTKADSGTVPERDNKQPAQAFRDEHKKSKRRRREDKAAAAASGGASATPEAVKAAGAAAKAVRKHKKEDSVYASLFGNKAVSNEHLFIATAGHRYNLG